MSNKQTFVTAFSDCPVTIQWIGRNGVIVGRSNIEFDKTSDKADLLQIIHAKNIGEQMSGKILCPRECVEGQTLSTFGDAEDQLFCPHCELEVKIVVKYS